jgi:hypothetical protein
MANKPLILVSSVVLRRRSYLNIRLCIAEAVNSANSTPSAYTTNNRLATATAMEKEDNDSYQASFGSRYSHLILEEWFPLLAEQGLLHGHYRH